MGDWVNRWLKDHAATWWLLGISTIFGVVTTVSGYHYWQAEGPAAHGDFWTWLLHHSVIEMFGEALVGGFIMLHITKSREKGSAETGDEND